jgi:hypothetical protein
MFGNHGRAHQGTKTCKTGKIRKDLRETETKTRARTTRFKIGDEELETVKEFKYLGRITSDDDDRPPGSEKKEVQEQDGPEYRVT